MKSILRWNAEFAKNLWMEFSTQRLIAMPGILLLIIAVIFTTSGSAESALTIIHTTTQAGFIAIGLLWGIKTSADAILDEYNEKTWDWQKMSIIGPWKLALGKLFGSTSYNWYGALICWVIFMLTAGTSDYPERELKTGILLIISMISLHGLMMLLSLQVVKKSDGRAKIKSNRIFIAGIIFLGFLYQILISSWMPNIVSRDFFSWYGLTSNTSTISIISGLFYCVWIVAGLYRSMRAELQFSDAPVWWLMFLISNFLFQYGFFATSPILSGLNGLAISFMIVFGQTLFLVYFLALSEAKDIVNFRLLENALRSREYGSFFKNVPLWMVTLPVAFIFGLLAVVCFTLSPANETLSELISQPIDKFTWSSFLILLAVMGFVIRDLSILLILNFSTRSRRADMATILYLALLYVLFPLLTKDFGAASLFFPNIFGNKIMMVACPLVEAGVALFFLIQRWRSIDTVVE